MDYLFEFGVPGRRFSPFSRGNSAEIFSNYFPTCLKYIFKGFILLLINIYLVFYLGTMVHTRRRAVIRTLSPSSSEACTPSIPEESLSPVEESPSTE